MMTVHICPNCDHEVKLPHSCPHEEKAMTETRKPYDPTWPHGFETRDGRKVAFVGSVKDRNAVVWKLDHADEIYLTNVHGDADGSFRGGDTPLDIFCTPSRAEKTLELWVNVHVTPEDAFTVYSSEAEALCWARSDRIRATVHMSEVTSDPATKELGSVSAEQVRRLIEHFQRRTIQARGHDASYAGAMTEAASTISLTLAGGIYS